MSVRLMFLFSIMVGVVTSMIVSWEGADHYPERHNCRVLSRRSEVDLVSVPVQRSSPPSWRYVVTYQCGQEVGP